MKLTDEKVDTQQLFSVGYDKISNQYILSVVITYIAWYNQYFIITKEEYDWFENDHGRLIAFVEECIVKTYIIQDFSSLNFLLTTRKNKRT